jgi:two-component system, NtrC family, sensor kinase
MQIGGTLAKDTALPPAAPAATAGGGEFRLVRYFTVTSLAAFLVVAAVLGLAFRQLSVGGLLGMQEDANVNITRILANELWASDFGPFVRAMSGRTPAQIKGAPQIPALHQKVLALMRGSSAFKVKVYSLDGMTLYSTELAQIGEDKSGNGGVIAARGGATTSEIVHRNSFSALEREVLDRDLVQSYIPAYEGERIVGVFEVYSDATAHLKAIHQKQWLLIAAVVGLFAILYGALFLIVNSAQNIIRRQGRARYQEFLAAAAHELRTPLTAIYGFADLLKSRQYDPAAVRDLSATIHEQAGRLVHLSNELLDVARIEARGAQGFTFEQQPLAPLLRRAAGEFAVPGAARRVQLDIEAGLPALRLDRVRIGRALTNILGNAHKFSTGGSPITLQAFRQGSRVGIRVTDRGMGMSAEELGHLFERFWRSEKVQEIPGSGLGLALTREIVELHGGTIEVHSAPEEGTQVTLWLPC